MIRLAADIDRIRRKTGDVVSFRGTLNTPKKLYGRTLSELLILPERISRVTGALADIGSHILALASRLLGPICEVTGEAALYFTRAH